MNFSRTRALTNRDQKRNQVFSSLNPGGDYIKGLNQNSSAGKKVMNFFLIDGALKMAPPLTGGPSWRTPTQSRKKKRKLKFLQRIAS